MTAPGFSIRFTDESRALEYARARRKSERANRWLMVCAFAAVMGAVAIEGWRIWLW